MEVLRQEDFKVEVKKVKNENDDEQRIKNNLVFSTIMGYNHHMMEFERKGTCERNEEGCFRDI